MNIREGDVKVKVSKWGNSLGLRIPRSLAAELGVGEGSTVDIQIENGDLIVRPERKTRYRLAELLAAVHEGNLHGEVTTGDPVGREDW
jgi:antitoxin MazE